MSEPKKFMGRQQILDTIKDLSRSQGLYSRIYNTIHKMRINEPEMFNLYMTHLVNQQFETPVDLVLFFES